MQIKSQQCANINEGGHTHVEPEKASWEVSVHIQNGNITAAANEEILLAFKVQPELERVTRKSPILINGGAGDRKIHY